MQTLKSMINLYSSFVGFRKYYDIYKPCGNYYVLKIKWLYQLCFELTSAKDFFLYRFYERNRKERKEFVTLGKSRIIIKKLNNNGQRELVEDKRIFLKKFKELLNRDGISSTEISFEEFKQFYKLHGKVIVKPAYGYNGEGIYLIDQGCNDEFLKEKYNEIKGRDYVIEEVLEQDGILKKLNPYSVNTIRINVLNNRGKIQFVNAVLRSGCGNTITDNITAGGIFAEVDINTGIVLTKFYDNNNQVYSKHPLTGIEMKGTKIPKWEELIDVVYRAVNILEDVPYTSWDMAICKEGRVGIIEGNTYGNFNNQQFIKQKGVLEIYETFMREYKR